MGVAIDAASYRADLVDRVSEPKSTLFLDMMVRSSNAAGDQLFPEGWNGEHVAKDIALTARRAEMFTATEEMTDLVLHAAKSLPPQTLEFSDMPAEEGWLYLPKPLLIEDVRQQIIPVSFVLWSRRIAGREGTKPGPGMEEFDDAVVFWSFVRLGDPNDPLMKDMSIEDMRKMASETPYASLTHVESVAFGRYAWKLMDSEPGSRMNVDAMMQSMHDIGEFEATEDGRTFLAKTGHGGEVMVESDPLVQFMSAYWHFCKSELTDVDKETLPRQMRRRFERKDIPSGPISVVRLRRRKTEEKGGEWHLEYRFVRRGHWRRQWYGPQGAKYQRWIWIMPTIVGPEDKPLVERDVVNLLQR